MFEEVVGPFPWQLSIIIVLAIFDTILKGIALWKAGNNKRLIWFIALFISSTAGILPLIYLLFVNKKKTKKTKSKK